MMDPTKINQADICYEDAEKALLGSLLRAANGKNSKLGEIVAGLSEADFFQAENKAVYAAFRDAYLTTPKVDIIVLRDKLNGKLADVGGAQAYLVEVLEQVCGDANLVYYYRVVKRKAKARQIVEAVQAIEKVVEVDLKQPDEAIAEIQRLALELTPTDMRRQMDVVSERVLDVYDEIFRNDGTGIKTGFDLLDWHLPGGLRGGDIMVVGARPSHGKTAFAVDIALHTGKAGYAVLIFSLEMTTQQIIERMLANIARVDLHRVRKNLCTTEEAKELADAAQILHEYKIFILDCSTLTPGSLLANLRTAKQRYGVDLVIVDYLQLMTAKGKENRQQEITAISRGLKLAAKSEQIPFIVLSQLNRAVESRTSHKPVLSDIRESGSIEQDADIVILMHRPDLAHKGESNYEPTGNGVFQIAKSRNGPTGEFELKFTERYASFANISKIDE